jgi:hypothetical protein
LRDRRRSKSESVAKVPPLLRCVPTIITSSLFIRFDHMSNEWKVEKVNYELDFRGLLRWYFGLDSKVKILRSLKSDQPSQLQKVITPKPLIISRCDNNHWKDREIL